MIFEESLYTRRIIGTLDPGSSFLDAIESLCQRKEIDFGKISASGRIDTIELVTFNHRTNAWETSLKSSAEFEIVSLRGSIASLQGNKLPLAQVEVLLATDGPAGQQLIFGHLRAATVVSVQFEITQPTDIEATQRRDPKRLLVELQSLQRKEVIHHPTQQEFTHTGESPSPNPPDPTPTSTPTHTTPKLSWQDAARASKEIKPPKEVLPLPEPPPKEPDPEEIYRSIDINEPIIGVGDTLIHRELGQCRIVRLQDDEFAHVRMARGKIRKLKLSLLNVKFVREDENGKSIFEASPRRG